ncbi:hypothetical protein FE773_06580 [Caminibacter mediatlanticus TB-2]|uniref:Septum formation initiator n=1 Tax=Caminibacter mediatlanticus TB-2 TaxID=391592 RepID=A0ABX5VCF5_9BACT|nr:hypothetical protein [Caminibacter mediatlanticus]QCT94860.1 hypothetical protein FE773_06580 [Caminibacter mediatlanticus TB-2]
MKEKEEILKNIDGVIEDNKISFYIVRNIVIAIIFSLVLLLPKIYISNHIYLYSIKINKLLNEYYSLKAENSILKSKIEKLKFKNRLNNF